MGVGETLHTSVEFSNTGVSVEVAGTSQPFFRTRISPWPATSFPSPVVNSAQISSGWDPYPCASHVSRVETFTEMETYLPVSTQWQTLTLFAADACPVRNKFITNEAIRNAPLRTKDRLPSRLKKRFAFIIFYQGMLREMDLTAPG